MDEPPTEQGSFQPSAPLVPPTPVIDNVKPNSRTWEVVIAAVCQFICGLMIAFGLVNQAADPMLERYHQISFQNWINGNIPFIALCFTHFILGFALLHIARWSSRTAIILNGSMALIAIAGLFRNSNDDTAARANCFWLIYVLSSIVMVVCLFRPAAEQAFRHSRENS